MSLEPRVQPRIERADRANGGVRELEPPPVVLRYRGRLDALGAAARAALRERTTAETGDLAAVRATVAATIARVRRGGDRALLELAREHDGAALESVEVPRAAAEHALATLDPGLRRVLERAARNLRRVHRAQRPDPIVVRPEPGIRIVRRAEPLDAVGIYAPGGRARYPSSVLMAAIPARVAGVNEVVLCSPPQTSGLPAAEVLAAAALAGVDRIFAIGGAGAIAALAYGTQTVPRVARIVGPGNAYVAEAKLAVARDVAIDSPAGPSEILVLADAASDPEHVAREMVAQAEHDPLACALAVVVGDAPARAIERALAREVERSAAHRVVIVRAALAAHGGVVAVDSAAAAVAFAEEYAAEHVLVALGDPRPAARLRRSGAVFLGPGASVAFGDYLSGANHVLPTGGHARAWSGLSVLDFMRWTSVQRFSAWAAARLADDVASFAEAERLPAHAAAARAFSRSDSGVPFDLRARASTDDELAASNRPSRARAPVPRIDLSDNTHPWGAPPAAVRVLRRASRTAPARYPTPDADALREALARYAGVEPDAIFVGCGSDDVIDSALRALVEPGERLAWLEPTFSMLPHFARANRLVPVAVPRGIADPAGALLASGARAIYLCSPNNPTGELLDDTLVERVIEDAPGPVLLDQAYAEFLEGDPRPMRVAEQVVIVRTLSKAFGLAGLRIGYGIAAPAVVRRIVAARGPYRVGAVAEWAAVAALRHDLEWVRRGAAAVRAARDRFVATLRASGFVPLESRANFVLVPVADAARLAAALLERGIAVRAFESLSGIGDALRVGIGSDEQLAEVQRALEVLVPAGERAPRAAAGLVGAGS